MRNKIHQITHKLSFYQALRLTLTNLGMSEVMPEASHGIFFLFEVNVVKSLYLQTFT